MSLPIMNLKITTVILFLAAFAALNVYYFYAEDCCPVHSPIPGGAFTHSHGHVASICLCFWSHLFSPGTLEFAVVEDDAVLPDAPHALCPGIPFKADIAHPPEPLAC